MLNRCEIAGMFSSRNLGEVARGNFELVSKIVNNYQQSFPDQFTVGNVFDFCYKILFKDYRNEYFYKNTLANKMISGRRNVNTPTIFTEFRVGQCKADLVAVNGIATCYEIKTEYDNLSKLRSQLSAYVKVFDKVNVVTSDRYIDIICNTVSQDIGVILLSQKGALRVVRSASLIENNLDTDLLMRSLRRDEYITLARAVSGAAPSVRNTEIFRECGRLIGGANDSLVRKEFRKVMKKTRKSDDDFILSLPSSLMIAGIESTLSRGIRTQFVSNLNSILFKDGICIAQCLKENNMS